MSTKTNTYVRVGVMMPFDDIFGDGDETREKLLPYMDTAYDGIKHHDGLCIVGDGMNGDYAALGRVLAKSDECGHLESPVVVEDLPAAEAATLLGKIAEVANVPVDSLRLQTLVFCHYR